MNEALRTFRRMTCDSFGNVIFLPESADGLSPPASLDGPMTTSCGPEVAPASRSVAQAGEAHSLTAVTCGLFGTTSSASANLQSSLESRLKARLHGLGSISFKLTWRPLVTPSGRAYFLLRASAHPKDATGHGSWQTPTTRDGKGESGKGNRIKRGKNGRLHVANLCDQIVDLGRRDLVSSTRFRNWLMGYPEQWEAAKPTATRSSRKSRPSSSAP